MGSAGEQLAAFGRARGLEVTENAELPQMTPLLCRGDFRWAKTLASGGLAPGLAGDLAHFCFVDEHRLDQTESFFHFTLVLSSVPETVAFVPLLKMQPWLGALGALPPTLGPFGGDELMAVDRLQPVELEFRELKDRYGIWADADLGSNWARQLFSPAFSEWLTSVPDLAFELADGALCVYRAGELESDEELAGLCDDAAKIAQRLRAEAIEEAGIDGAGTSALPDHPGKSLAGKIEAGVAKVDWDEPPPDTATAIKAYRGPAMRDRQPWLWGVVTLIVSLAVLYFLLFGDGEGKSNPLWLLLSPLAAVFMWWLVADDRAEAFGKAAFVRGYARSRSLTEENPRLYQARHMSLSLPGRVEVALSGDLPASGRPGALLFTSSRSGKTETHWDVVVLEHVHVEQPEAANDLYLVREGDTFAACRKCADDTIRSADDLDAFVARISAMA